MLFRTLLVFALLPVPAVHAAKGAVFSRTVGTVGESVFTSREAALAGLLDRLNAGKEGGVPVAADTPAGRREQAGLLLDEAVAREAGTYGLGDIAPAEIDALALRAEKHLAARKEWKKLAFTAAEIRAMAARKLAAKNLVRIRSEAMRGTIPDAEAQTYFEKNRVKFGQLPFASFKDNIKSFMAQQQLEDRLRSWFEILRRKHKVREAVSDEAATE